MRGQQLQLKLLQSRLAMRGMSWKLEGLSNPKEPYLAAAAAAAAHPHSVVEVAAVEACDKRLFLKAGRALEDK
jgi:hypothetical protein